ncbi:restriction endonuclease family protein [Lyngbya aestuarii BL J]|uniref:Restriction endonuclease family protein n=1 Tax=Lyngbya aestuarii BL J TaxID=1348334 RepID=U7QPD5_9CYAN|nr:Uma2 family endonuclease [Lyngbya aestuarii]ERT09137.1 restriction endonuclease family protein [Lyngbya aestuarii BL J]
MTNFTLNLESIELTDEQFFQLCQNNRDLKFERNSNGDLVIMSPTGGETSNINAGLTAQLWNWNAQTKLGKVFDSSGGFKLPNGADRSPDAAWITLERWESLTSEQRKKFIPLCPDFVIELRSASDRLKTLQDKMQEYIENGLRLGWLINFIDKSVEIYRQNQEVQVLESPPTLSGEDVLPGFILNLQEIW